MLNFYLHSQMSVFIPKTPRGTGRSNPEITMVQETCREHFPAVQLLPGLEGAEWQGKTSRALPRPRTRRSGAAASPHAFLRPGEGLQAEMPISFLSWEDFYCCKFPGIVARKINVCPLPKCLLSKMLSGACKHIY